jgi:DNA-binding GntR family transcriptional regulator
MTAVKQQKPIRASSRELVGQLREHLRLIAAEGRPSPSEKELGESLNAGKSAIRDALIRLESHGIIRRRHGARLDINTYALRTTDSYTFRQEFASDVTVLSVRPVLLDEETAEKLDAEKDSPAMELVRLTRADGAPIGLDRAILRVESLPAPDFDHSAAPRDIAAQLLGEEVVWLNVHPTAMTVDTKEAELLEIEEGMPVLVFEIIGLNADGQPMFSVEVKSVPERRDWVLTYTLG